MPASAERTGPAPPSTATSHGKVGTVCNQGSEHRGLNLALQPIVFCVSDNAHDAVARLWADCRFIFLPIAHVPTQWILVGEVFPYERPVDDDCYRRRLRFRLGNRGLGGFTLSR